MAAETIGPRLYSCFNCRNHVARRDDVISKTFWGNNGRAFLFSHAMNVVLGPKEDTRLLTGLHMVADVYCSDCREKLGWKYEKAYEETQKYKEGKFILEKTKIVKNNWLFKMEVYCHCKRKAVMLTTWTNSNPGRRFCCCPNNWPDSCDFFVWFDPPMCHRSVQIIPGLLQRINEYEAMRAKGEQRKGRKWSVFWVFLVITWLMLTWVVLFGDDCLRMMKEVVDMSCVTNTLQLVVYGQ